MLAPINHPPIFPFSASILPLTVAEFITISPPNPSKTIFGYQSDILASGTLEKLTVFPLVIYLPY